MDVQNTQPHKITIHFSEQPDKRVPYPYHVLADGRIARQDRWKGRPFRLAGFQEDLGVNQVDVDVEDFLSDPDLAVGLYPVFIDHDGGMWTRTLPVSSTT